ncbi:MAG: hypothetical protein GY898_27440 [Proteobacteria bacterium]|nr:hypothetical protein [Pseudomonadota bacterium]
MLPKRAPFALILAVALAGCDNTGSFIDPDPGDDDDVANDDDVVDDDEGGPWVRDERAAPGSVTFNELQYHPRSDRDLEWVELHNPMVLDMDLSGWRLGGGIDHAFADGTVLAAGGHLVAAADPARLASETGFDEAVGPYDGRLANDGERVDLFNNCGRLIDTVEFGEDDPWPVEADGSGLTLAKVHPDAASDRAEHWTVSVELGGTPGEPNGLDPLPAPTIVQLVPFEATWSYDLSGEYPASDWAEPDYDASGWPTGDAVFFAGGIEADFEATARGTADNNFGLYLGEADGGGLRLVGEDPDGDWTTVESFELDVTPQDHLYLAAWEVPGSSGGPQMAIAEVDLPARVLGTGAAEFEWILGPADASPGALPADASPDPLDLALVIEDANALDGWTAPAAEAVASSGPWGPAVGASFAATTNFIWGDTFADVSATNTENSYALFRSREPLAARSGTTELLSIPTTITFRTAFSFDADPDSTELTLDCLVDDGVVVYLNGEEVLRHNVDDGPVDADTLAVESVEQPSAIVAALPAEALAVGPNVLAVELHQAELDDGDMTFACALDGRIAPQNTIPPRTLVLNEAAAADAALFWIELLNVGSDPHPVDGLVLVSAAGEEAVLSGSPLDPGALAAVDDLALSLGVDEVLFLYAADGETLLDAVRLTEATRGRAAAGGAWRVPAEDTPGAPNAIDLNEDVVINEVMYHPAVGAEEWVEVYNRGADAVDLSGWSLVDAVGFEFPPGSVLEADGYLVVGDFDGRLDNASDRIVLLDASGNPADEVRYHDGGRWPEAADGGGSSLELRDAWADNVAAEAWAPSDESDQAAWGVYSYRGLAGSSAVGPDGAWEEFVLGLLDAGELLLDDLSVVRDPDGAAVEVLRDGSFDDGGDAWRLLGTHRHSAVVPDPDDPGNAVLRLVATGPTGHMHNHAETTLLEGVGAGEYEISFRARWVSGSNQLHTRLYFNRLPRTTRVDRPDSSGTPGASNSTAIDNLGPTFANLRHDPAVPRPNQPVPVTISAADPEGVGAVTLWSSVAGAPFVEQPMTEEEPGRWSALLGGEPAGTVVQLYVEAEDSLGASSRFPVAGPDSRALIQFDDGLAPAEGLSRFRIVMTEADSDWFHTDTNLMSNDSVGATVVYHEAEVFYDVGVRAKGSERGRPTVPRLGYGVQFRRDQPFRGSHGSVLVDRSEGVGFGQREVLLNLVMTHAGSVSGEYNDLVQVVTPRPEHTGPAELQLDRFTDLVLASQFENGSAGTRFEYELIYYPLTTDDGTPEGLKRPQPDSVVGTPITDLGDDPEAYRWAYLIKNNEGEDDYSGVLELTRVFSLSGPAFADQVDEVIDVEQWLRSFAFATLGGVVDQYGGDGSQHNAQFYVRPLDQRVLYFPHDLDFFGSAQMAVVGNGDLTRLLGLPGNRRSYYGHLQDIVEHAYNAEHLLPWCDQMAALLPLQNIAGHCQFIASRADWVMNGAPDAVTAVYPAVEFRITTGGGADFSVDDDEVVLEGNAGIEVRRIALEEGAEPLDLTWLDDLTWRVTVPLEQGANDLTLRALDLRGEAVGSDTIVVTSTGG